MEFQSPIGTQKTREELGEYEYFFVFQSPIGTQKTPFECFKSNDLQACVSIPYRYTKNEYCNWTYLSCTKFQSPIGTQKTRGKVLSDAFQIFLFQSPIGTQKTSIAIGRTCHVQTTGLEIL